jgi:hypothetical protein
MDSLRFSTARAATPSAHFGTGLISSLLRPRRASAVGKSSQSRGAMASPLRCASVVGARSVVNETQPSSSPPRRLRAALVRRPSCVENFFDRFENGGAVGTGHSGNVAPFAARSLWQRRPLHHARCRLAHRVGRRSLRTLSVVARFAHLPSRGFERCLRRILYPPRSAPCSHWALRSCGGFHTRRCAPRVHRAPLSYRGSRTHHLATLRPP